MHVKIVKLIKSSSLSCRSRFMLHILNATLHAKRFSQNRRCNFKTTIYILLMFCAIERAFQNVSVRGRKWVCVWERERQCDQIGLFLQGLCSNFPSKAVQKSGYTCDRTTETLIVCEGKRAKSVWERERSWNKSAEILLLRWKAMKWNSKNSNCWKEAKQRGRWEIENKTKRKREIMAHLHDDENAAKLAGFMKT